MGQQQYWDHFGNIASVGLKLLLEIRWGELEVATQIEKQCCLSLALLVVFSAIFGTFCDTKNVAEKFYDIAAHVTMTIILKKLMWILLKLVKYYQDKKYLEIVLQVF